MERPPRTPPRDAAQRLFAAAGFLDPALLPLPAEPLEAGSQGEVWEGRFEARQELGRGAVGVVWRVYDRQARREVALKLLTTASAESAARLLREGQLAASLDHPRIVRVYEAGRLSRGPYLLYALVPGARSLEEALPLLAWSERWARVEEVAEALAHAHARGVVHRDLKAANVLIDEEGRARVTDFGVGWGDDLESMTASGAAVGTPLTMAPEQITGLAERRGPGVDVWALGVLLYRCAADRHPFEGADLAALARSIVAGRCEPLARVATHVPAPLARVCERCLEANASARYPDAGAALEALRQARVEAAKGAAPWRRARAGALGLLALAASGALLASALFRPLGTPESPSQPPELAQAHGSASLPAAASPPLASSPSLIGAESRVSPSRARAVKLTGDLGGVDDRGRIWGWAADELDQLAPVRISLSLVSARGVEVWRAEVETSEERLDVKRTRGYAGLSYGFRAELPARFRDGRPYRLHAALHPTQGGPAAAPTRSPLDLCLPAPIQRGPDELLSDPAFARGLAFDPPTGGAAPTPAWRVLLPDASGPALSLGERRGTPCWALELAPEGDALDFALRELPPQGDRQPSLAVEQALSAEPLGELGALRLRLDFALRREAPRAARKARFSILLAASASGGPEVCARLDLYRASSDGQNEGAASLLHPAPRVGAWTRVERDLLPLVLRAGRGAGLSSEALAALRLTRLRLGWEDARGLVSSATCAGLSLSAPRR